MSHVYISQQAIKRIETLDIDDVMRNRDFYKVDPIPSRLARKLGSDRDVGGEVVLLHAAIHLLLAELTRIRMINANFSESEIQKERPRYFGCPNFSETAAYQRHSEYLQRLEFLRCEVLIGVRILLDKKSLNGQS
jgi:hypothetical protein